jgi:hypothetical protein
MMMDGFATGLKVLATQRAVTPTITRIPRWTYEDRGFKAPFFVLAQSVWVGHSSDNSLAPTEA